MRFLSYAYRISSNFVFLALVCYSLNFLEKYQQRAIVAILVLIYAAMRAASALRSFYFFQRIERLELEARRLAALTGDGPAASASRKQIVKDVATLRHGGEMKSHPDLLFLTLVRGSASRRSPLAGPPRAHCALIGTGMVRPESPASTEISFARPSVSRSVGTGCSA
jgi:hypothetical protein